MPEFLKSCPDDVRHVLLLAHGAGAPMDSPFLEHVTRELTVRSIGVLRFEFAYMAARRSGQRKPPPRGEKLIPEYEAAITAARAELAPRQTLAIGGKSLGGRVASLVADAAFARRDIVGLVCLGYPFHPPGKPEQLRTAHLEQLACPALIVQGERDPFGTQSDVAGYALSNTIELSWAPDGDHDLGPRGASGFTRKGNLAAAADAVAAFLARLPPK